MELKMPEYMSLLQLEGDNDVVAQYEAIRALRSFVHSQKVLDGLEKVLRNKNIFYRVRIEAAKTISLVIFILSI